MKFNKRVLAVLMAVLLMIPSMPISATGQAGAETVVQEVSSEKETVPEKEETSAQESASEEEGTGTVEETSKEDSTDENVENGTTEHESSEITSTETETTEETTDEEITEGTTEETTEELTEEETTEEELVTEPSEEVLFNTGKCVYSVVGRKDFFDYNLGDACFEENGSYTINIPEENPFFPYEVQFTHNGEKTNKWFMSPDDSVEIGGHTFYVSAYFDNTAITQMSLKVAGRTIIVYPQKKEFTDGDGVMPTSLLPLEEEWLDVDLSAYTPAELTMVSVDSIFAGDKALKDSDKVVWTKFFDDDYKISTSGDVLDLSYDTYSSSTNTWEMIVGDADQLAAGNKRYFVNIKVKESKSWLTPTVYVQDTAGNRSRIKVSKSEYYDYNKDYDRRWEVNVPSGEVENKENTYLSFSINPSVFGNTLFSHFKVYEGKFTTAAEAMSGTDITDRICAADMTKKDAGYTVTGQMTQWITMITYDNGDNITGCLPIYLNFITSGNYIGRSLYDRSGSNSKYVIDYSESKYINGCYEITNTLYSGYAADQEYHLVLTYYEAGVSNTSAVTGAYVGQFSSIAEAAGAGAKDIKASLFDSNYNTGGYPADYSKGVYFTIFAGSDGENGQEVYHYLIKTKEGSGSNTSLSGNTMVRFRGLLDKKGNRVKSYQVDVDEDSYAEYNYLTILVEENVDLSNLAPEFITEEGIHLYAPGSSSPEISGKSVHDFSNGPVQYTAAAENGSNSKNYWLQIVKVTNGEGWLYMNSLADDDSETKTENGIIYSTREMLLDAYHDNVHDILLANMGTDAVSALSVELISDSVQLDRYWTLSGDYDLSGCTTLEKVTSYGGLPNLAKIRIRAKEGTTDGADISGTLKVKSGSETLMVLNLTGSVGDPSILTKDIPQAVKYVPYGTMIQNSNKYGWNKVNYRFVSGTLPIGMEVKANGEIYGVPREAGEFTFTVKMENGYNNFKPSTMTYTLKVLENTDPNVEAATDTGYNLMERIQNVAPDSTSDQTLVSQGIYAEFVDVYLDGVKLTKNVDYTSESGSTRITIRSQTLKASNVSGTHTLGIEFRTQDTDTLKRAAQNYQVEGTGNPDHESGNDNQGDGGSSSSSGGSGSSDNGGSIPENNQNIGGNFVNNEGVSGNSGSNSSVTGNVVESIIYTVQEGDTLWKVAEKYFGSGLYWEQIYQDNLTTISNPDRIYAGQVIVINLTSINNQEEERDPNLTYYTVKPGDSLWRIALQFYGNGRYWRKINQANDNIPDPKYIYEGQVIIIPDI